MNFREVTPEMEAGWAAWVAERPPAIRKVAERFTPWKLYRMKSTKQRVTVYSISDTPTDPPVVTLTVNVTGEFNFVTHERQVFGIDPDDLEECDLPEPGERLGCLHWSRGRIEQAMKEHEEAEQRKRASN